MCDSASNNDASHSRTPQRDLTSPLPNESRFKYKVNQLNQSGRIAAVALGGWGVRTTDVILSRAIALVLLSFATDRSDEEKMETCVEALKLLRIIAPD